MRRVALAIFVLISCSAGADARQTAEPPPQSPIFEFHSGFWINLHHFLYLQGRISNARGDARSATTPVAPEYSLAATTDGLTPDQQKAWSDAVAVYARNWSARELSTSDMTPINDQLAALDNCPALSNAGTAECRSGLRPELEAALDEAAPVYRTRWWVEQDRQNRAWIAAQVPLVQRVGTDLANQLVDAYRQSWSEKVIRVDAVWYAGPQGAYSSMNPLHITIASHDSHNQNMAGVEMLFHEASTTLAQGVDQAVAREWKRRNENAPIPIPRDLLRALLFYTTGQAIQRAIADTPRPSGDAAAIYVPYTKRNSSDEALSKYQRVLERYWQPYLDGQITMDTAVERMVAAL